MAVTVEQLAVGLRLSADGTGLSAGRTAILTRLLGVGQAHVELLIPTAPDAIKDEVIVRLAAYLYDAPVGRRDAFAHAWINSGAGALASRWKQQAASGEHDASTTITGGLTLAQVQSLIATHRGITDAHHDPAEGMGGPGEDQTARDAAATAQAAADGAQAAADGAQGEIDTHEGTPHNTDLDARQTASENTDALAAHIAEHPDGSGVGITAAGIVALTEGDPHSNVEIPGTIGGLLRKFNLGRIIALAGSSVGLGPRLAPTPTAAKSGEVVVVNEDGDGHTTEAIGRVPLPVNGRIIIGAGPIWVTGRLPERTDSYPHVATLPAATADSPDLVFLEHDYTEGLRSNAVLRIGTTANFVGYNDSRLGPGVGSINKNGPVVRIRVEATGNTITRWDSLYFFEESTAYEFDRVTIGANDYSLGEPFTEQGLWVRRFLTEPSGLQVGSDIGFNLRRTVGGTYYWTDGTGRLLGSGLYQKEETLPGVYIYDRLTTVRRVHEQGVGAPTTLPTLAGETYIDQLGREYVGLLQFDEVTQEATGSDTPLVFPQYVREPSTLVELLAEAGAGGFYWPRELGSHNFVQFTGPAPPPDRTRTWDEVWANILTHHVQGSANYNAALAHRAGLFIGGFSSFRAALEEASLIVSQADFDNGQRIYYGLTVGGQAGVRRLTAYQQAGVTRVNRSHWVGPQATVEEVEEIVEDHIAAIPASGGGFPSTRTQIFNENVTDTVDNSHVLSEALLPNAPYEMRIGSSTRFLFLTGPDGDNVGLSVPFPAGGLTPMPTETPHVDMTIRAGATFVNGFKHDGVGSIGTITVVINKLT